MIKANFMKMMGPGSLPALKGKKGKKIVTKRPHIIIKQAATSKLPYC